MRPGRVWLPSLNTSESTSGVWTSIIALLAWKRRQPCCHRASDAPQFAAKGAARAVKPFHVVEQAKSVIRLERQSNLRRDFPFNPATSGGKVFVFHQVVQPAAATTLATERGSGRARRPSTLTPQKTESFMACPSNLNHLSSGILRLSGQESESEGNVNHLARQRLQERGSGVQSGWERR